MGRLKHEALREEVHCFDGNDHTPIIGVSIGIMLQCSYARNAHVGNADRESENRQRLRMALDTKTPASSAGVVQCQDGYSPALLASDRCAGNAADIGPVDTEVLQFAAGHAAKFGNGLTELAPVVERACYVHDNPLS